MMEGHISASPRLSRRERALIEYFRRVGNILMPAMVALCVATVIWIAAQTIAHADRVARPMTAASER